MQEVSMRLAKTFPHFKVAKDLSNNLVKWQVLLAAYRQQAQTPHRRRSSMGGLEAQSPNSFELTRRRVAVWQLH